jgi:hypothetical protein
MESVDRQTAQPSQQRETLLLHCIHMSRSSDEAGLLVQD